MAVEQQSAVRNLFEAVFVRPRMYTLEGTFGEALAFVSGYVSGVSKSNPSADLVVEWNAFEDWLAQRLGVEERPFEHFRASRSSDRQIEDMRRLLAQFFDERSASPKQPRH